MSTTAMVEGNTRFPNQRNIMPREKSTRQIVREEIQYQNALKELEEKHNAGKISDFEYKCAKALLYLSNVELPDVQTYTAGCVA